MQRSSERFRLMLRAGLLSAGCVIPVLAVAAPTNPSGTWLTEDGRARVRIEHCQSKADLVCGYVVWMKEPNDAAGKPLHDKENPDRAKRTRALLGHQLVLGLTANDDDRYEGKIYDADNGKSYDITLWRESPTEMKVKGCMLGVLCGSQSWTPVTDVASGQLSGPTGSPTGPRADVEYATPAPAKPAAAKPIK